MNTAHRRQPSGIGIMGIGAHVPEGTLTNSDLEKIVNTTDEWIRQRTGIEERRYVDEGVGASDLALEASKHALEMAGLKPENLDFIIIIVITEKYECPIKGLV